MSVTGKQENNESLTIKYYFQMDNTSEIQV